MKSFTVAVAAIAMVLGLAYADFDYSSYGSGYDQGYGASSYGLGSSYGSGSSYGLGSSYGSYGYGSVLPATGAVGGSGSWSKHSLSFIIFSFI